LNGNEGFMNIIMTTELYCNPNFVQANFPTLGVTLLLTIILGLCFCLPWKYGVACHDNFFSSTTTG